MAAYTKTFNRFELKYLVSQSQIGPLVEALAPYTDTDPYSTNERGYQTHSVYCDAPDLQFFWEKIDGQKVRRKVRFRRYEGQSDVFLEIKQRITQTVQKRRVRWPIDRVRRVFYDQRPDEATEAEIKDPAAAEILLMWRTLRLRPTMSTYYRRRALRGIRDPGLRITFDTSLSYSAHELDVGEPWLGGKPLIDPRHSILEIKFDERAPRWLSAVTSEFGLATQRFSKYCGAVDKQFFGGQFTQS